MQSEPGATADLVMIVTRGLILVIAALAGLLSIYLGWKLYRERLASAVSAEASKAESWVFKLRAVGPGVFFALFGMLLLGYLARQQMTIESDVSQPAETVTAAAAPPAPIPPRTPATSQAEPQSNALAPAGAETPQPAPPRLARIRTYRRYSDGSSLSEARILTAMAHAETLLGKLDRASLTLVEQMQLETTLETFGEARRSRQ